MDIITCSFTGHREIFRIHEDSLPALLSQTVDQLIASGVSRFCSGGARGFDLLAAQTVLEKKAQGSNVSLAMVLPYRDQASTWRAETRNLHTEIVSQADEVICTSESYNRFCMHLRNRRLVDEAQIILAYLAKSTGGTANTVNYAAAKQRKIINLATLL